MVYPTHGAGLAVLDRDRLDVVVDHRLRAPPRPAPGADGGRGLRAGAAGRAADVPALLRADAPDQPGRTAAARRERPGHRAAVRRRAGRRRWVAARSWSTPGRPPRTPAAHVPGSLSIPAGPSFGTWLGWVVEADAPIVLHRGRPGRSRRPRAPGDADRLRDDRGLRRRRVRGLARGRVVRSRTARRSTSTTWRRALSAGGPTAPLVIDVRQPYEFEAGPRARRRAHRRGRAARGPGPAAARPRRSPLVCASGYRSSVAASLLRAGGFERVAAVAGGIPDWEAHGYPLDYGAGTDGLEWPATPDAAHGHDG